VYKEDSKEYLAKKAFFDKVLTIYGRNAVMEALEDEAVTIHKLHLSKSNKDAEVLEKMKHIASHRNIEVKYHDKQSLSRISKNAKQDQGVALDIVLEHFGDEESFKATHSPSTFTSGLNGSAYLFVSESFSRGDKCDSRCETSTPKKD